MYYFLLLIPLLILVLLGINKIDIDWASFLKPTLPLDRGVFGVYCFCGKQGTGKTYAITKFIKYHSEGKKIYSNMTFSGIDYEPIRDLEHLFSLADQEKVIIVYDEILNMLNDVKIPREIRDDLTTFLTQQRKVKNILITSTQRWMGIPYEVRDLTRIQINVTTKPLGRFGGILKEEYRDADNMEYDKLISEYVAPRISLKFSKYEKKVMQSYNTYERIKRLQKKKQTA